MIYIEFKSGFRLSSRYDIYLRIKQTPVSQVAHNNKTKESWFFPKTSFFNGLQWIGQRKKVVYRFRKP